MNEDILHVVSIHAHTPTLLSLCRVSKSMHRTATRCLYWSVRITTLPALVAFYDSVANNDWLASLVFAFCEELYVESKSQVHFQLLRTPDLLFAYIWNILRRLTNVRTIAIANATFLSEHDVYFIVDVLTEMRYLRNVRLPAAHAEQLQKLGEKQPLEYVSMRLRRNVGVADWLRAHATSLCYLHIDGCDSLLEELVRLDPNLVFPHVHTITARSGTLVIIDGFSAAFPALRSLTFSHPQVDDIERSFPGLQHLQLFLGTAGSWPQTLLSSGHRIPSLRLRYSGKVNENLLRLVHAWASPHIRALAIDWAHGMGDIAIHAYNGLKSLDLTIRMDAGTWIRAVIGLPALPTLEVLTLRYAYGVHKLVGDPIQKLRIRFPALYLVRFIGSKPTRRAVYAWSRPIDWIEACEIVANYLPHWRSTRAPWDDIRDI